MRVLSVFSLVLLLVVAAVADDTVVSAKLVIKSFIREEVPKYSNVEVVYSGGDPRIQFYNAAGEKIGDEHNISKMKSSEVVTFLAERGIVRPGEDAPELKKRDVGEEKEATGRSKGSKAAVYEQDGEIIVLKDSNFDSAIAEGVWLVEFYAPWCGHCKKLAPTWKALAEKFKDSDINIAKVDCTEETKVKGKMNIRGFPTIKRFVGGKSSDYKGARSLGDLATFAEAKGADSNSGNNGPKIEKKEGNGERKTPREVRRQERQARRENRRNKRRREEL